MNEQTNMFECRCCGTNKNDNVAVIPVLVAAVNKKGVPIYE